MSSKSRRKGQEGEREFLAFLTERIPSLEGNAHRNYDQAALGGADLVGIPEIALEIKRYAKGNVYRMEWWEQACRSAKQSALVPVLAYRFDRTPWSVVCPLEWMGGEPVCHALERVAVKPAEIWVQELIKRVQL